MKRIITNITLSIAALVALSLTSCSLEEENPGGFTMETMAESSLDSYRTLVNQCYFGMERYLYGTDGFMELTEADTDLWTYRANQSSSYTQYFWYYGGAAPNTTYINGIWNSIYDGIGACNTAISLADDAPFKASDEATKNAWIAEARFLRAIYYFNAVEQFGAVTVITEPSTSMDFHPDRTEPLTVYQDVILPDLEFACEYLEKGDDTSMTRPTKKAAMGMLCKAYLQTYEYGTTEYLQKAYDLAKTLISDCESGGSTYGCYMYSNYSDVFSETNNKTNKEALWKHCWYAGSDNHGSSNGNYKLNRNDEKFLCCLSQFGARQDNQETRLTWEGSCEGIFMPTQHLLNLYVQADGTLDPRFHQSFSTQWNANKDFTWDDDTRTNFEKDASVVGKSLAIGDLAIKITMPQDDDYASLVAQKATAPYLIVDYADVYDDAAKNVIMTNSRGSENLFRYLYPSLNKHNSSNYYVANANKKRNGNLNATFIMRMAEVYLIAAECDILLNGGNNALQYINKVRQRAGANLLSGTPTIRTVLDERGRELCGEYCRFYDLKRTGMLADASYLNETHPDLGKFFKAEYALRPISTTFNATLTDGSYYQNPGY